MAVFLDTETEESPVTARFDVDGKTPPSTQYSQKAMNSSDQ